MLGNDMDFAKIDVLKYIWFQQLVCLTHNINGCPSGLSVSPFKSFWQGKLASVWAVLETPSVSQHLTNARFHYGQQRLTRTVRSSALDIHGVR